MASPGVCSGTETESIEPASGNDPSTSDKIERKIKLVAKKNTASKVWKYFGFTPSKDGSPSDSDTHKCRLCLKDVSAKWANTSYLMKHLKVYHTSEYREILRDQLSTISSSQSRFKTDGQQTLK